MPASFADPAVTVLRQRVVLAGGGHAHLAVLADWARHPAGHAERVLVTAAPHTLYSGMVPGWMAGRYTADDMTIDLRPLAQAAGARLIVARVTGLDAGERRLQLSNGESATFDVLSLATGGEQDLVPFAASGERLLPVRPMDAFVQEWPRRLAALVQKSDPRIAVIGAGAAGVELALAVRAALTVRSVAGSIALIAPNAGFMPGHGRKTHSLVQAQLAQAQVTVMDSTATGHAQGVLLADGTVLTADCVILATGSRPPAWLAQSGLACSPDGFALTGATLRSVSHERIFVAGDIAARADRPLPRSGVHAVKAGPVLAHNIRAALAGGPARVYQPSDHSLALLATGQRRAILSWGRNASVGWTEWRLKDWIDRRFIARYKQR